VENLFGILIVFTIVMIILSVRNELVFRIRSEAIDVIFSFSDWKEKRLILKDPSYYVMVFDLTRWSLEQYYPELYERKLILEEELKKKNE